MYYCQARYYSPELMRFINRDTYDLSNRYAYGDGDPVNNVDPNGHSAFSWTDGVGMAVGTLLSFIPGLDLLSGIAQEGITQGLKNANGEQKGIDGYGLALSLGIGLGTEAVAIGLPFLCMLPMVGAGIAKYSAAKAARGAEEAVTVGAPVFDVPSMTKIDDLIHISTIIRTMNQEASSNSVPFQKLKEIRILKSWLSGSPDIRKIRVTKISSKEDSLLYSVDIFGNCQFEGPMRCSRDARAIVTMLSVRCRPAGKTSLYELLSIEDTLRCRYAAFEQLQGRLIKYSFEEAPGGMPFPPEIKGMIFDKLMKLI